IKKSQSDPIACNADILALMDTLDIIGGKWTLLVVHYLIARVNDINTFNKIQNDINNISPKMLISTLKMLVANRLVNKNIVNENSSSVGYSITDYGLKLKPVIDTLVRWGQDHRDEMMRTNTNKK